MEVISGASAALALVEFVGTTVKEVNKLTQNIRRAPKEILSLLQNLEKLECILANAEALIHRLHSNTHRHGSLDALAKAVAHCSETLKSIDLLINKAIGSNVPQSRVQQKVISIKYVWKKDEIEELKIQLRDTTDILNLAILVTMSYQYLNPGSNPFPRRFPMLSVE